MKRYIMCVNPPSASRMPKIFEYDAATAGSSDTDICPACGRYAYGLNHHTDDDVNMLIIMRRNLNRSRRAHRREGARK